jgi:glycosyltransferase involved in cell wall biosynthesis
MLESHLETRGDVLFVAPVVKGSSVFSRLTRPFVNFLRLCRAVFQIAPGGRVLFFSGAGFSFFEKLFWALWVKGIRRKPVLVMVDGNFPEFWQGQSDRLKSIVRRLVRVSSLILGVQSESWARYYRTTFSNCSVEIVAATAAPIFWQPTPTLEQEPYRVLYVGWMIPEKGIKDLLDAFISVAKTFSQARLRLVGPLFGRQADWEKEIAQRGLQGRVDLVGPVADREALIREFRLAALLVLPSHAEGLPVVLLEAMAMGVACVGTRVGAIPDVLDEGSAGRLVPVRSPDAIATAVIELLANPMERNRVAAAAEARARLAYSPQEFARSFQAILGLK